MFCEAITRVSVSSTYRAVSAAITHSSTSVTAGENRNSLDTSKANQSVDNNDSILINAKVRQLTLSFNK